MKKVLIAFILGAIITGAIYVYFFYRGEALPSGPRLFVGSAIAVVEIADDPGEWERGLSGRDSLGKQEGMLFIFPNPRIQTFWMKEMRFSLDIVYIDNGRVVEITENIQAPAEGEDGRKINTTSKIKAEWILEVNSGWVEKNGVRVGDAVQLNKEERS